MVKFEGGGDYLVEILSDISTGKAIDAEAASALSLMDPDEAPIA